MGNRALFDLTFSFMDKSSTGGPFLAPKFIINFVYRRFDYYRSRVSLVAVHLFIVERKENHSIQKSINSMWFTLNSKPSV